MTKQERQFAIREIIGREHISNQDDLARMLKKSGVDYTQATISRDLAEMGVARMQTVDGPRYVTPQENDMRVRALLSYEVTSIDCNESMVVVKTLSGRAHGVAELLDSIQDADILATIAGDNTIFIAPTSTKNIPKLVKTLRAFITSSV